MFNLLSGKADNFELQSSSKPPKPHTHVSEMDDASKTSEPGSCSPASWESQPRFKEVLQPYRRQTFQDGKRPYPQLWDIGPGCILWLPSKDEVRSKFTSNDPLQSQKSGFFDHPVLVLHVDVTGPSAATILFAKMTTMGNRDLSSIYCRKTERRLKLLPIFPAQRHPTSEVLLHLERELSHRGMCENSYISLGEGLFSLDWRVFQCYAMNQKPDGYRQRLTSASFAQVLEHTGRAPEPWIETRRLWEEFIRRQIPNGVQISNDWDDERQAEEPCLEKLSQSELMSGAI